ncbi:MAG: hypothetical protein H0V96_04375 [Acidimicrobiia bacterium]|nr:hypothetical protein [Acidimicrobiia bacterium]
MRSVVVAVLIAGALVGCSGDSADDAQAEPSPTAAVAVWLDAVATGDVATIDGIVDPTNVALVAGAENGFTVEQFAAVAESGLPDATRRSYWSSFAEALARVLGVPVAEVDISATEAFASGTGQYAAVTVVVDAATTEVITRLVDGAWQIDMVATVGPTLAIQIRRVLTDLAATDEDTAGVYARIAVESLGAAHTRSPSRNLELELEAIEALPVTPAE